MLRLNSASQLTSGGLVFFLRKADDIVGSLRDGQCFIGRGVNGKPNGFLKGNLGTSPKIIRKMRVLSLRLDTSQTPHLTTWKR